MDITLPITTISTILNAALFVLLTFSVISYRRRNGVVLGDNGDRALTKRIRGQANAAEQMPMALILIGLSEVQGMGGWPLAILAILFTLGRIAHGAYFCVTGLHWRWRFYGMLATATAQIGLILLLIVQLLR